MINTYNETNLHRKIKDIYCLLYDGKPEQKVNSMICDVLCSNGDIYEIQTSNVSKLKEKAQNLIAKGHKVTIVHPIITTKYIQNIDKNGTVKSTKKSPKTLTIYSLVKQITGIYSLFENKNFIIEVLYVTVTEKRQITDEKMQLLNKSRKHLKNWIPIGKELNEITGKTIFTCVKDYVSAFLPYNIVTQKTFSTPQLKKAIYDSLSSQNLSEKAKKDSSSLAPYIVWLLQKLNIIELTQKKGRKNFFTLKI